MHGFFFFLSANSFLIFFFVPHTEGPVSFLEQGFKRRNDKWKYRVIIKRRVNQMENQELEREKAVLPR